MISVEMITRRTPPFISASISPLATDLSAASCCVAPGRMPAAESEALPLPDALPVGQLVAFGTSEPGTPVGRRLIQAFTHNKFTQLATNR